MPINWHTPSVWRDAGRVRVYGGVGGCTVHCTALYSTVDPVQPVLPYSPVLRIPAALPAVDVPLPNDTRHYWSVNAPPARHAPVVQRSPTPSTCATGGTVNP